jgi:hypothetical protein
MSRRPVAAWVHFGAAGLVKDVRYASHGSERIPGRTVASDERRASDRLPVIRNVRYKVIGEGSPGLVGSGKSRSI